MLGVFLQIGSLFEGGFGGFLNTLSGLGFFNYALPFLLIFALVFGILMKMNLFKENTKGIAAIIAIAVGLMALQFNAVPEFFSKIFPSFGIGIAIILVVIILVGFFSDPSKPWIQATFFIIAAIIALIVIVSSSGLQIGDWVQQNLGATAGTLIIIAVVVAAVFFIVGKKNPSNSPKPFDNYHSYAFKPN